MGVLWPETEMKKKTFFHMAWQFFVDMLKKTPECLTEAVQRSSQPSEAPQASCSLINAVRSIHPAMTDMEAHAEVAVEQEVVPKVTDGTWAGEAFGPAADHLWHQYGKDMGSTSRLL